MAGLAGVALALSGCTPAAPPPTPPPRWPRLCYADRDPGRPGGAHRHPAGRRLGAGRRRLRHRRLRPGDGLDLPAHGGRRATGRAADPGPRRPHGHPVGRRPGAGGRRVRRREPRRRWPRPRSSTRPADDGRRRPRSGWPGAVTPAPGWATDGSWSPAAGPGGTPPPGHGDLRPGHRHLGRRTRPAGPWSTGTVPSSWPTAVCWWPAARRSPRWPSAAAVVVGADGRRSDRSARCVRPASSTRCCPGPTAPCWSSAAPATTGPCCGAPRSSTRRRRTFRPGPRLVEPAVQARRQRRPATRRPGGGGRRRSRERSCSTRTATAGSVLAQVPDGVASYGTLSVVGDQLWLVGGYDSRVDLTDRDLRVPLAAL